MNQLASILLQAPAGEGSQIMQFLPLILIVVVFYFLMIRPQMRRQKEMRNFRDSLQKGDKVITTGGIYGKINAISDNVVTVDAGNSVILKIDKSAILKDSTDLQAQQQK